MLYYAGIGSRQTPEAILNTFTELGRQLASMGFVLRSGGADGADAAFQKGCDAVHGMSEIFIPWRGFNNIHNGIVFDSLDAMQRQKALESVNHYHPAPDRLSFGARKLMARNYCQMFGSTVSSPVSSFVVCYTKDGRASGGTGQAMRMAEDAGIMIFNAHGTENAPDAFIHEVLDYAAALQQ